MERCEGAGPRRAEAWAVLLAAAGIVLLFTYPPHRVDLLVYAFLAPAAAVAWQPRVGPFLVALTVPLYFVGRELPGGVSLPLPVFLLLTSWLGALGYGARGLFAWRTPPRLASLRTVYDVPLCVFLASAVLSLAVSEYPLLSARELRAVVLEPMLFFWLLAVLRPAGGTGGALTGFLTIAAVTSVAAIGQVAFGVGGTEAEGVRRAQAWYPSPNHLALMLGRALPFYVAILAAPRGQVSTVLMGPALLGTLLVAVALLLSFSTGGWLGALAAVVVVLFCVGRRRVAMRMGVAAGALLVVVSALSVFGALPERLNPMRQTGGFRLDLWLSALHMARDHPILGVGADNFVYQYQQVYIREGGQSEPNLAHPHNWVLHFWLALGLPGLVAVVWLLRKFYVQARQRLGWWPIAGAVGGMTDVLVHGLLDNSYFLPDLAYIFWLLLAIGAWGTRGLLARSR